MAYIYDMSYFIDYYFIVPPPPRRGGGTTPDLAPRGGGWFPLGTTYIR